MNHPKKISAQHPFRYCLKTVPRLLFLFLFCTTGFFTKAYAGNGLFENLPPVVNVGNDTAITMPVNSLLLSGAASDTDGSIATYNWIKVSGPDAGAISQPDSVSTPVTGLVQGVYIFRLTVTDNEGAIALDEVQVTVKPAVIANAGKDTLIYKNQTRPDSAFLNGLLSSGGDTFHWDVVSGPTVPVIQSPDSATSLVTGFTDGFYQFRLSVNNSASDTVVVFVRDWQKKGVYPCRSGYDTITKTGGQKIVLEPNYKGTYLKPDGSRGTWNQWNYILDVRAYIQTTKKVTLYGGDTLLMEGADSTVWVELGGFGGSRGCPVYVMPRTKPVRIRGINAFFRIATRDSNSVQHVVVDGTVLRSAGYPYGFLFDNSNLGYAANGPFSGGWMANFTLKGLRSTRTNALKIKLDPSAYMYSRYDKFIQKNIVLTDNWIDSSSVEGMYIGSTASDGGQLSNPYGPPPRMDSIEISNNIVTNCAWDGIQLANAKNGCVIRHNLVFKAGTANMPSQRAGILMGGNTTGVVDSNIVINSRGDGIQVFGYGSVNVYNNIIDSIYGGKGDQDGIYQSFVVFSSEPSVAPLRVYNYNNLISRIERNMIRMANTSGKMLPGRTHHNTFIHPTATIANSLIVTYAKDVLDNNSIVSNFPYKLNAVSTKNVETVISMTQGDTTQTFAGVKPTVDWLFKRLNGVSPSNMPPVANAGQDTITTLPADSIVLTGDATDEDGSIKAYQWKKVSGPGGELFENPIRAQTLVKNLIAGTYQFELAATDNGNGTGKDTLTVIVNTSPLASAGVDKTITLPVNSLQLNGEGTDTDGTITATIWTKLSGPDAFHLNDSTALQTMVDSLEAGVYVLELRAVDNHNAVTTDTLTITVNSAPAVFAGPDQAITLPANAISLSGQATDADGSITSVAWTKVSGPNTYHFQNASELETVVDSLTEGTYYFELAATDNQAVRITDTVVVIVNPAPNSPPVADAGTDILITLPLANTLLQGTGTDVDGTITKYQWSKLSGPDGIVITTPDQPQTALTLLTQGQYRFELNVTDNRGTESKDTVTVIVNAPPVVTAGVNVTVTLPVATASLSGTATDGDGTIAGTNWTKLSGPVGGTIADPLALQTTVNNLTEGVYQFELRTVDDRNASAADTIQITVLPVPNTPPVASAGTDQVITLPLNTALLTGSGTDGDGSVQQYKWTKVSGPAGALIVSPDQNQTAVQNLVKGSYSFELTVRDNGNLTASDTITIIVNAPPTVNAGTDQTITSPVQSVPLNGSATDADGSITATNWTKISGPSGYRIQNKLSAQTTVDSLVQGIYLFELKATDNRQAVSADTVQVTVLPKANVPPAANAGADKSITLPTNSVTLSGSGTDADGTISTYNWTKVSGPSQGTISSAASASTTVIALAAGSYIFRLTVTDNKGATASDDVIVTVNSAPVVSTKTINVNIYGGSNAYASTAWNNWSIRTKSVTNVSSSVFKYSDGSTSTLTATLSNSTNIADNSSTYGGGMAPAAVLRYNSYYTGTRTLTLKGLAVTKKYTIELYASRNVSGSSTIFTINGVSQTIATFNNLTGKATFTNLSPNTAGQMVISIAKIGTFNCLNGFALVESNGTTASITSAPMNRAAALQEEPFLEETFQLYPNPVSNNLMLKLVSNQTGSVAVHIVAASGRVVKSFRFAKEGSSSQYSLPLTDLAAGVYFIKIQVGAWTTSGRFAKL